MSATGFASASTRALSSPAVVEAIHDFNMAFDYDLRAPIWPHDLENAATIAELRGRSDIAGKLREAAR